MKTTRPRLFGVIAYRFDNLMSKGLVAVIGLLTFVTLVFVGLVSAIVATFHLLPPSKEMDFLEVYWAAILRTLDAGTMGNDEGFGFRFAMFVVTIGGVIVVASLIGAISNAFSSRVERLRKGRSKVVEDGHTLILGWNSKIFSIIRELEIANESIKKPAIVILADQDKVRMEDDIHTHVRPDRNTRIVVRSGDPLSTLDVELGSPTTAKSIIVLAPDNVEDPDAMSLKTCLALLNGPRDNQKPYSIVAELMDEMNVDAAAMVGGHEVRWIQGHDLICRLIVQTCRQSGLSAVFTELLDFEGSELYLSPLPNTAGSTYEEVAMALSKGCLIGFMDETQIHINPKPSTRLSPGSRLIVIAEDDSQICFGDIAKVNEKSINNPIPAPHSPEKTLVLGVNSNIKRILGEMSVFMPKGSSATIVSTFVPEHAWDLGEDFTLSLIEADPTFRQTLEALRLEEYTHIVVLAESDKFSLQHCDSRTLLTLLHLRELARISGLRLNIVSEMLDDKNRQLAETTDADDFIVSDKLVSLMIAQISENPQLSGVFSKLLSSEGSEIRLHPAEWYVHLNEPVSFATVVKSALNVGDTAIGFQLVNHRDQDERLHGLILNPSREGKLSFTVGDKIAVLTNS